MRGHKKFVRNLVKSIIVNAIIAVLVLDSMSLSVQAAVATESTVTQEMCSSAYWNSLNANQAGAVLMTAGQINSFNSSALKTPACNMNDLTSMDGTFDGAELKNQLVATIIQEMPQKPIYVNSVATDTGTYYTAVSNMVQTTGWDGTIGVKYALAVSQTQIKSIPTADYIGYSEFDSDDEVVLSSLKVNEPFIVKQCAVVNNQAFYWGYSNNVSGWVLGNDLAFSNGKAQWLDMWQTSITGNDFIVVTDDYFTLCESHYAPATSEVKLTMGTTLKLVPDWEVPRTIATRGTWNNYVVYLPTRDTNGNLVKQMALIAQNKDVHVGYLPMTSASIVDLAFKYLGDTYGWGGMLDSVDCSAMVRNVYKCFGLEMPRNTNWQKEVPGTCINVGEMDVASKAATISGAIPGTALYMPGHTMIYLGTVNGTNYVISAMGSASDSTGYLDVKPQNSVTITPITVRRKNGTTWLDNINGLVMPWNIAE